MDPERDVASKTVDATIALLGLLLAFTFAMALDRHEQRRVRLVEQANAIGDFYTCATVLPGPERAELQTAIRTYARHELDAMRDYLEDAERRKVIGESFKLHNEMTEIVSRAIARGTPIAVSLINTLNNITSAHASRTAVYEERLPWPVQALLVVTACVAAFLVGRQQGPAARKCVAGTVSFILLVSMVIFVIKDLSQPRRGWIKTNADPMVRLVESLTE
jgi:phosphate/sulfate permease